ERVWKNAKLIAANENVDLFVVELGALLHDIADAKFYNGDENIGPEKAKYFLESISVEKKIIDHVENIIRNISFKGGHFNNTFSSGELLVVQDADRLDAMGAIGIARAFNYGGFKNREIYNPAIAPDLQMSKEQYKKNTAPTINHFYEKLLLLKDLMNTATGKKLAEERHRFMEIFLDQFYFEWKGEK
ncbi:MAG: HD domain-containing protein, partial [Bacteroidota bacterium]|nr:HD domain-containing protein [Bacteroidota bacterium]